MSFGSYAKQGYRFSLVGILNTAVDVSMFAALTSFFSVDPIIANIASYGLGIVTSYLCNSSWTFASPKRPPQSWKRFSAFAGANVAGLALSTIVVAILVQVMPPIQAKGIAAVGTLIWNFLFARRILS